MTIPEDWFIQAIAALIGGVLLSGAALYMLHTLKKT